MILVPGIFIFELIFMILPQNKVIRAFTLVELLVVVGILAILISLLVPATERLFAAAQEAKCSSNLRALWVAFSPFATDPEGWPQVPSEIRIGSREEQQWWLDYSTSNLGLSAKDWRCPTIDRYARASAKASAPLIHYLPTIFDSKPGTPNRWPSMPWFSEMGDVHGKGNLTIRSDGAILPASPLK